MDPGESARTGVVIGERIGGILESFGQRDEPIAAGAEHIEHGGHLNGVEFVRVHQENLRDVVSGDFDSALFEEGDDRIEIGEPGGAGAFGERVVTMEEGAGVDGGEHVIGVIERDRRDGIAMGGEELLDGAAFFEIESDVEVGVAEVAGCVPGGGSNELFAAKGVVFELSNGSAVEVEVRVSMIAEFHAGGEPELEHLGDGGGAIPCIDEGGDRDVLIVDGRQETASHSAEVSSVAVTERTAADGEVVDGDGDAVFGGERG